MFIFAGVDMFLEKFIPNKIIRILIAAGAAITCLFSCDGALLPLKNNGS